MENILRVGAGVGTLHFPDGYFPSDGYSGVHDDIHVKALLLECGDEKGAIVTYELPSIRPWEYTDELRKYAAEHLGVSYDNLWLIMTHDLSAPHMPKTNDGIKLHMEVLRSALEEAVSKTLSSFAPVTVTCCEGTCDVNANRDVESVDGWWVGIHGTGPSDKTLTALRFDGLDGAPVAVLYSYAIKSSVLEATEMSDGKHYVSGDVTGLAGAKAEAKLGCPVLFVMGAAGDQVPRYKGNYLDLDENGHFYTVNLAENTYKLLDELSDELSCGICSIVNKEGLEPESSPTLRFCEFSVPAKGQVSYPKELPEPPVLSYDYPDAPGEDIPVWYMRLGKAVLMGVKPEIVTPTFTKIKEESPYPYTMIAALVNGGQGYIATDWDYEHYTYPGLKTPFRRGTEPVFINEVHEQLQKLSKEV
jgi:hypothetical protein